MSDNFDKVVSSVPVNKQSSIVTSKGVERIKRPKTRRGQQIFDVCPDIFDFRGPDSDNLTGKRFGYFTVVGFRPRQEKMKLLKSGGAILTKNNKPGMWVVRCDCGYYEVRSKKALTRPSKFENLMCTECQYVEWVKNGKVKNGKMEGEAERD